MLEGWVKTHRKLLGSDLFKNPNLAHFWEFCRLKATHQKHTQLVDYVQVKLEPGQFVFGRNKASLETGLSEKTVRTCLKILVRDNRVKSAIHPSKQFSIVTICNWKAYQCKENEKGQPLGQEGASPGPALGHKQECKEGKEHKETTATHDPRVKEFIGLFSEAYQKEFDRNYIVQGAKDGAIIKKLLGRVGDNGTAVSVLQRAAQNMLRDDWARSNGASIGLLSAQINKYLGGGKPTQEESDPVAIANGIQIAKEAEEANRR